MHYTHNNDIQPCSLQAEHQGANCLDVNLTMQKLRASTYTPAHGYMVYTLQPQRLQLFVLHHSTKYSITTAAASCCMFHSCSEERLSRQQAFAVSCATLPVCSKLFCCKTPDTAFHRCAVLPQTLGLRGLLPDAVRAQHNSQV
ncbi:TPA: hypothetical protein ACH3X1_001071 [Trebouxia sp. C0004]